MLVARLEIWPFGNMRDARLLGTITIANDGTGDVGLGNYTARVSDINSDSQLLETKVQAFPRKLGAVALLSAVLKNLYRGYNG